MFKTSTDPGSLVAIRRASKGLGGNRSQVQSHVDSEVLRQRDGKTGSFHESGEKRLVS